VVFYILLNKTPWDQRSSGLPTFQVMNSLQERIKFMNRGSTVYVNIKDAALTHFGEKCTIFREHRMNHWESLHTSLSTARFIDARAVCP
jgi:hypothetical protein